MTRTCEVAIVGGGIGGLTLAAGLLQQSISVEIFEQDTELREIGAGVAIAGNATRLLQGLGIDLTQVANIPRTLEFRRWRDGSLERYSKPHLIEKKKRPRAASNASS
jgi:salicylate hydroxylase